MVSDTIEFRNRKLALTSVTPEDKVLHGVQHLTAVPKDTPTSTVDAQLQSIKSPHDTLDQWAGDTAAPTATTDLPCQTLSTRNHRAPRVITATPVRPPSPRMQCLVQQALPRVQSISTGYIPSNHQKISQRLRFQSAPKKLDPTSAKDQPVAHHTWSHTTQKASRVVPVFAAQRNYPAEIINLWCTPISEEHTEMSVLDNKTGELLEYQKLHCHPKYKDVCNTSYSNELRKIFQGVGSGTSGP